MDFDLSVIIPVRNEEGNIAVTLDNLERSLDIKHETIVVNDYSVDNTERVVRDLIENQRYTNVMKIG